MARTTEPAVTDGEVEVPKQNALAIAARSIAVNRLIENHLDEWNEIHGDEREAKGLGREAGGESVAVLTARATKAQAKLEKLQAELAKRGVTLPVA